MDTARGGDEWAREEILALPDVILDELARLFEALEQGGEWPDPWLVGLAPLLAKEGQDRMQRGPTKQRPVTILSL